MSASIRFPASLRTPDRDGYGDTHEEARTVFQPDTGAPRRRNKYRLVPRIFDVKWTFTQAEYTVFDAWVQNTIDGGAREFDVQLLDDDESLVWYTVKALGSFSFNIDEPDGELRYTVSWRFRALHESFGAVRLSRTDELAGRAYVGVTTSGRIKVYTPFRGRTDVGVTSFGKLNVLPLYGRAEVGMYQLPRGNLSLETGNPELSRQWQGYGWLGTISTEDINAIQQAREREWMEN